ncbi:LPS export ABC transporter periplasmic protein LptC [Methylibium sp.]|uniref:LPS export ABC transporter periplasmic protein LptC n=1 Tax=Methylibium sp. TaxID=2067992 RepID=UPI003D1485D0
MTDRGDSPEPPFSELLPLVPQGGAGGRIQGPWTARLLDQLLRYLPVLLMSVLAALSWWLVKNTPVPGGAQAVAPLRHEPDYTMRGFAVVSYGAGGQLRSRLEGDVMQHFPDTDTIEVEGVRLRAVDETGRVTLGSARQALSNGDATQVRLTGGARVVREPGPGEGPGARIEIRGEFLELFTETERVRSHLPVTMLTGRGELRAGSLDYNHLDRIGQLSGRVTGELRPTP